MFLTPVKAEEKNRLQIAPEANAKQSENTLCIPVDARALRRRIFS